jgi:hypothetical protein
MRKSSTSEIDERHTEVQLGTRENSVMRPFINLAALS